MPGAADSQLITDITSIAQVVIALVGFGLGFIIFTYQRRKDRRDKRETAEMNEQSIRLEWFRALVTDRGMEYFWHYFEEINKLKSKITTDRLPEKRVERRAARRFAIDASDAVRKSFIDTVKAVDPNLGDAIQRKFDDLYDAIERALLEEHALTNPQVFESLIGDKIWDCRNGVLKLLYEFQAVKPGQ
jgi:hypothetical protein